MTKKLDFAILVRREARPFVSSPLAVLLLVVSAFGQADMSGTATSRTAKLASESAQRVLFEEAAFSGPSTAIPYWDRGRLISRDMEMSQPDVPNVRLYDRSGKKVVEATIWFPGSTRVTVSSAAVTPDGRIVASGSATKADGTRAPYIALTDSSGRVTSVIQTGDYFARNVCIAPDGTAWTFGGTAWDDATNRPKPGETLRHFDFRKGQIGGFIPRSTFPDHGNFEALAHMRCLANKVVVYGGQANVYIDLPYGSDTPQMYTVQDTAGIYVVGFAVPGSGEVYGHLSVRGNDRGMDGLYVLAFDETAKTARWMPVEGAVGPRTKQGTITGLWGADGDKLVVSRAEDPYGPGALHWVAPRNR